MRYHIACNTQVEPDGIIFIIPGFGGDSSVDYQRSLIKDSALKYNVIAVFVEYHSIFARVSVEKESAVMQFGKNDTELLIRTIDKYKIQLDENRLDFDSIVEQIKFHIEQLKKENKLDKEFLLNLWATLYPYKNEYQNFGILQAIDILTVLYHIKSIGYSKIINQKKIIALGSSHGGYIANLLMKLAPNTFDVVIDNSSYVKPKLEYIIGFEKNFNKSEYKIQSDNILLNCSVLTHWTKEKNTDNEFHESAYEIRDLLDKNQMKQFIKYSNKTSIISYHSKYDRIAIYEEKEKYCDELMKYKFDINLNTIELKSQIDGKLIKNLDHAMGMSIKELVRITLPEILENKISTETDICKLSKIEYKTSKSYIYLFDFLKDKITAKLHKT